MSFVDDLVAAERGILSRLTGRDESASAPAGVRGPTAHRLIPGRPRSPEAYLIPQNSYRQPVTPLTQAGILRRYEILKTPALVFNNFPGGVILFPIPLGVIWRLLSVSAIYTCDATVATRGVILYIIADAGGDQTSATFAVQTNMSQAASQAARHAWLAGVSPGSPPATNAVGNWAVGLGGLPERLLLYEGARLAFSSAFGGAGAGDSISFVEIYVEEWTTYAGTAR